MEIFLGIQLRCQPCFVSALLYRLFGWVATDKRQYQYWARAVQSKDKYLARKTSFDFLSWKWQNSITQGLKRYVHFEVRLIMVFICSLSTIIYFVHRKESGKLVLLVFAPLAAININITRFLVIRDKPRLTKKKNDQHLWLGLFVYLKISESLSRKSSFLDLETFGTENLSFGLDNSNLTFKLSI